MTGDGNILIVDDEVSLRQTLARILKRAGYQVTTAGGGEEALRLLAHDAWDLVYLDIRLPGIDGLEVLKRIHEAHPELPVILFTAHASLQTALDALRLGATDYLIKPIDPDSLIARTQALLSDHAVQRRRRQILQQIDTLQAELRQLDEASQAVAPESGELPPEADRFLKRGSLTLDLTARRASWDGRILDLPPAALDYLVVLTRHAPDVVDYETLVAEAQGYHCGRSEAQGLAKWHMHVLRQALEAAPSRPRYVLNVRGVGYRLVLD